MSLFLTVYFQRLPDSHKVRDVPQDILSKILGAMRENFLLAYVGPIPVPHCSSPCLIKRAIDRTANYNRSNTTSRCYSIATTCSAGHHAPCDCLAKTENKCILCYVTSDIAVTLVAFRDPRSNPKSQIPSPRPKSCVAVRGLDGTLGEKYRT